MKLRSILALALWLACAPAIAQVTPGTSPLTGPKGGTNNAFMQFSGPATSIKTFTLPNASDTIATLAAVRTWTGAQSFTDGTLILLGLTSGSTTLKAPATGGGTATIFTGTDTFVGRASTDTLTNKTFNCASNTCTVRIASDVTGLGTGVATALGVNVGTAGAVVVNGGVLGTPSSGTLTNATGLPTTGLTGTLQAAQEPAHTGDMTNSAGSLATTVTKINGIDQTTAWSTYTPTIGSQTGTITASTATGRFKQIGKTMIAEMDVTITTVGTGAGYLSVSLPSNSAANNYVGTAFESAATAKSGAAAILTSIGQTALVARDATGATFLASGARVIIGITYELP